MPVAATPQGGFPVKSTSLVSPRLFHTGNVPAMASTDGTNATPSTTEEYLAEVLITHPCVITGVAVFNGSDVTGNTAVCLRDANGTVVASSAATAGSGTDAYQRIPFSTVYEARPGTYYVGRQQSSTTARFNAHPVGTFGAGKLTGQTFGTFATATMPVSFTADLGPIATLY